MARAPTDADLMRLRHFLKTLQAEARIGDVDLRRHEIEMLKREIVYLEDILYRSRAILFRIAIDYGASQRELQTG